MIIRTIYHRLSSNNRRYFLFDLSLSLFDLSLKKKNIFSLEMFLEICPSFPLLLSFFFSLSLSPSFPLENPRHREEGINFN